MVTSLIHNTATKSTLCLSHTMAETGAVIRRVKDHPHVGELWMPWKCLPLTVPLQTIALGRKGVVDACWIEEINASNANAYHVAAVPESEWPYVKVCVRLCGGSGAPSCAKAGFALDSGDNKTMSTQTPTPRQVLTECLQTLITEQLQPLQTSIRAIVAAANTQEESGLGAAWGAEAPPRLDDIRSNAGIAKTRAPSHSTARAASKVATPAAPSTSPASNTTRSTANATTQDASPAATAPASSPSTTAKSAPATHVVAW